AKIMTIHGSKGLEFEYVILLDKLTRKNSDKSALIYHYNDQLYIDKILYRIKGRENFDQAYKRIMDVRKVSELKDRKNILYVALTRAVEGLIVLRKPKDSIFDEIHMEPMSVGGLRQSQTMDSALVPELVEGKVTISNYGTQEVLSADEEEEKDYEAILFGTALHYTLEMLGTFDAKSLSLAMLSLKNRYGLQLTDPSVEQIEVRIKNLIDHKEFQQLLDGAKITKEQSLSFEGELKQIDLLLEYEEHCLVIDYKSSKKYALKHQKQVRYYTKAIESITQKKTKGMIVYILEDDISIEDVK
ncbi:MAG: Dna2/Cas4 domain-containing protein, partial [Sulfurovum sp.]|nr:Dna2/Cas4 domain-containing protein [Sulfurovum sp.]